MVPTQPVVTLSPEGVARTNSRNVAEVTGKEHRHVLRDIDALLDSRPDLGNLYFQEVTAFDRLANRDVRSFEMTRDGMVLLIMGYTGERALEFKLAYIERFNAMEEELRRLSPTSQPH